MLEIGERRNKKKQHYNDLTSSLCADTTRKGVGFSHPFSFLGSGRDIIHQVLTVGEWFRVLPRPRHTQPVDI